jgi:hypothetical protein
VEEKGMNTAHRANRPTGRKRRSAYMATEFEDRLLGLVGGPRYCFVIMPYGSLGLFYEHLRHVIKEAAGLSCIRADEIPDSGQSLLEKIHRLIEKAELIVAEISEPKPNVYYEVGYAMASHKNTADRKKTLGRKRVLVICRKDTEVPLDLQGLERIEYVDTPSELPQFDDQLRLHLDTLFGADIPLLRAMLVAPAASPSYILCSPRWRSRGAQGSEVIPEGRTYGDYLGVVGVLYALGILLGKETMPELLSAQHVDRAALKKSCNLFLIGSPRSNSVVADEMAALQESSPDPWRFIIDETGGTTTLVGSRHGQPFSWTGIHKIPQPREDYGIVIRGPRRGMQGRQVLIMAGTRSLGTGAACLAATRPHFIRKIKNLLTEDTFGDKTKTIWALVRGLPDPADQHVSEKYITIEDAGLCE